jgi:diguanylate cyclase (GGDEF)-like protein
MAGGPPDTTTAGPRRAFGSVASRVVAFVWLASLLTAFGVSWIAVESSVSLLRPEIEKRLPSLLARARAHLVEWLDEAQEDVAELAQALDGACPEGSKRTCPAVEAPSGETGTHARALLEAVLRGSDRFDAFVLLDADGRPVASAGAPRRLPLPLPPDRGPRFGAVEGADGRPVPLVSIALREGASLHGWLRRERIAALLDTDEVHPARLQLVDASGRPLDAAGPHAPVSLREALQHTRPGEARGYRSDDGTRVVGARLALEGGWQLVLEEPFASAYERAIAVATRVVAASLVLILVLSTAAHRVTTAALRPLGQFSEAVRRVARGELDVRIPDAKSSPEIALLIRTFNEMSATLVANRKEIEDANRRLQRQNQELQGANEVLEQLSITDGLTKLHNHRFFQDYLTREIKRVRRSTEPLSMLLLDLDDFKRLNDRLGHAAGDQLLKAVARTLNDSVRESDFLARYGGEEFVVLAPGTDLDGAVHLAEKIRAAVAESSFIVDDSMRIVKVTVSIGVAQYQGDRKAFFANADRALYRAKAEGKDCVVADAPVASAPVPAHPA